jgi:hypothetical protein
MRIISEFIAILTLVAIAVVGAVLIYNFVGELMSKARPEVEYLKASVVGIEVVNEGSSLTLNIGTYTFTASYIYKLNVVIHNAGDEKITSLSYTTIDIDPSLDVCTSDSCDIFDPVIFTRTYTSLPQSLDPNQAVQVTFTVASKTNLLALGSSPFLIKISGYLPDGSRVVTYVGMTGEQS